jgi:hypothetical protein
LVSKFLLGYISKLLSKQERGGKRGETKERNGKKTVGEKKKEKRRRREEKTERE